MDVFLLYSSLRVPCSQADQWVFLWKFSSLPFSRSFDIPFISNFSWCNSKNHKFYASTKNQDLWSWFHQNDKVYDIVNNTVKFATFEPLTSTDRLLTLSSPHMVVLIFIGTLIIIHEWLDNYWHLRMMLYNHEFIIKNIIYTKLSIL